MTSGPRLGQSPSPGCAAIARRVGAVGVALLCGVSLAAAQRPDPGPAFATREALERGLQRELGRKGSSAEAQMIRARLDSGDFRPGDRIVLVVEGEKQLTDTFTVGLENELRLPPFGAVPLAGVLRSELSQHLTQALARYLRSPVVQARSLVRVSVEGEVSRPGFYSVAPESPLLDVFALAGGLTREANLHKARVQRGGSVLLSGRSLEDAFGSGRSLDALNLRAGDRVFVPRKGDFVRTAQILGIIATIPVALYSLTQIFK